MYRKLQDLQEALSASTQTVGKLKESIELEKEQRVKELEAVVQKHGEELKAQQEKLVQAVSTSLLILYLLEL